jgi:hypothetical protein
MKTLIRISSFVLIVLLSGSCFPKKNLPVPAQVIAPLTDTTRIRESTLVYALPRNIFTVKVSLERTIEIPGPYAKYAGDLLGLNNVIIDEKEFWSIMGISVISHEECDPSEFYIIETSKIFNSNVLALKREGLILDLNPSKELNEDIPLNSKEIDLSRFRSYDLGSDEYYQVLSDTAFRRISVDSTFIRIPYLVEKRKKLTAEQLAERAARRLMELRDGKMMILTGEANVFPQNQAAVDEINRLEKEYTELFTGRFLREARTFTCQLVPEKDMSDKPVLLFRFSENTGPGDITSKEGTPVNLMMTPEQKTRDITVISGQQPESTPGVSDKLFYRIPDVVSLKITLGNEVLYSSRKLIYQFGEVVQLPANYIIGK